LIEQLAVMGGDVFHIAHVFVTAFDLEAANACVNQVGQVGALVVVLHRQHMLVMRYETPLRIGHMVGQATGLRAIAPVGAATGVRMADVALAAVGHAQGAMDEELQLAALGIEHLVNVANLGQRELTGQHHLRKTHILQELGFGRVADVGLGAGMQLNGGQIQFQQAHVLHDQDIGAGVVDIPCQLARRLELVIAQDGVERDEDAAVETVGLPTQALDVAQVVAGTGAGAKGGSADVNGIGTVMDRGDANVGIARGGQQLNLV
jgi:hypothetical protein